MNQTKYKIEDHEERFSNLFEQLVYIKIEAEDLHYIFNAELLTHKALESSHFLDRAIESIRTKFCLDLCALIDKDEHINMSSFIDMLIIQHRHSNWKENIKIEELQEMQFIFQSIIKSEEIQTLVHYRNKQYAHKDKNFSNTDLSTDLNKVIIKLEEIILIFNNLGRSLFKAKYFLELPIWQKDHNLMQQLSVFHEVFTVLLINKRNSKQDERDFSLIEECFIKYGFNI